MCRRPPQILARIGKYCLEGAWLLTCVCILFHPILFAMESDCKNDTAYFKTHICHSQTPISHFSTHKRHSKRRNHYSQNPGQLFANPTYYSERVSRHSQTPISYSQTPVNLYQTPFLFLGSGLTIHRRHLAIPEPAHIIMKPGLDIFDTLISLSDRLMTSSWTTIDEINTPISYSKPMFVILKGTSAIGQPTSAIYKTLVRFGDRAPGRIETQLRHSETQINRWRTPPSIWRRARDHQKTQARFKFTVNIVQINASFASLTL